MPPQVCVHVATIANNTTSSYHRCVFTSMRFTFDGCPKYTSPHNMFRLFAGSTVSLVRIQILLRAMLALQHIVPRAKKQKHQEETFQEGNGYRYKMSQKNVPRPPAIQLSEYSSHPPQNMLQNHMSPSSPTMDIVVSFARAGIES